MQRNEMLASISANNDLDFYSNVKNVQPDFFDIIMEYFETGERADHEFTPLEFLNLWWEQKNFVEINIEKAITVKTTLQSLPLEEEEKHILLGFILLYNQSGYPISDINNHNKQFVRTYTEIQKVFLGYEGNTPEKIICQKDWKEVVESYTLLKNTMINLEEAMTKNPQTKSYKLDEKETKLREELRQIFSETIKGKTDKQAIEFIKSEYDKRISIILEANNTITTSKLIAVQALLMIGEIDGRKGIKKIKDRNKATDKDKTIMETFEKLMETNGNETDVLGLMGTAHYNYLGVGAATSPDKNKTDSIRRTLKSYGIIK